jgi:hypothetical protein
MTTDVKGFRNVKHLKLFYFVLFAKISEILYTFLGDNQIHKMALLD